MNRPYQPDQDGTLTDHLTELRDRLIRSVWAIALTTAVSWYFNEQIFDLIRAPVAPFLPSGGLIFTSPADKFIVSMKVALLSGIILACPLWIYQVWMFVAPGLYANEKKYSLTFIASGTLLFLTGVGFAYFLVLPTALEFLLTFGGTADQPMITITDYLSFFMTMTLVFGGAFELPLAIIVLGAMGIVDQKFLREKRRYAVVALATLAAIITPPDVLSMMLLLVPMWALYEISIILVGMLAKKKKTALHPLEELE